MKRKLVLGVGGAAAALGMGVATLWMSLGSPEPLPKLNASLAAGASLNDGPVPVVGTGYDLSAHQTLSRVVILIKENYVDPERIRPYEMFLAALDHIQKTVAEVVVDDSQAPSRLKISVGNAEHVFDLDRLGGLDQLWEVTLALRDIFRFLQGHISDPEQQQDIEYAAINGMLFSLDPHSVLLKPENFDEVKLSTKGEFGGLGIVISIRDGALTVISPIEGTPASRAGIKAKDQIVKIGEESTVNMSLEEAVQRLRGKAGTKVNVWILRKGWTEARRFVLTRANIKIESVSSELLADQIGYLRIKSFQANTYDDLHTHLERLRQKNQGELKGLILDLRNNPGGLLDQAILVSDRFIERGPIVITVGEGNRKRDVKSAHPAGTELGFPMVALVNGGSASASEIVSGSLKNHGRAVVIGQQTFGKGSVQVLYDFKDRSALKLTIAQYLTPGDISIQSVGITPDIEVVPAVIGKDAIHLFVDDDSPREKDLERHLDVPVSVSSPGGPTDGQKAEGELLVANAIEPAVHLVHLAPVEPEPVEGEETATADKFEYDFETRLGHDLLIQSQAMDRKEMIVRGKELFAARAREEETRIIERFKELQVDWTLDPAPAVARAEVTIELKNSGPIHPGDTAVLRATVRNTGEGSLSRVYGVSSSDNPMYKNLEFVFGKIPKGQVRTWDVSIKVPKGAILRTDRVQISLGDHYKHLEGTQGAIMVVMEDQPQPRFSYAFRIDDRGSGNGDGVLQVNEPVDFKIDVVNVGSGRAEEAMVAVKNRSSKALFLKHGREKLGEMKPGAAKSAVLKFSVKSAVDEADLEVSVWDNGLGELMSDRIRLPVRPARKLKSEKAAVQTTCEAGVFVGADTDMPRLGQTKSGAILRTDANLGDWYRVLLGAGGVGFVRREDIKLLSGSRGKVTSGGVRLSKLQAAPQIAVNLPVPLATRDSALRIVATVSDERYLRDVFVFVNDKKVSYRALDDLAPTADGVKTTVPFTLPLKIGANVVVIVARESDVLVGRRVFGVFREEASVAAETHNSASAPQ